MPAMPAVKAVWQKPVLSSVGQVVLRDAMRARGKTVTALAADLGISRKHLSNVLNGRAPLIDPLLRRLCDAAGADAVLIFCLLDYDGPAEPRPDPYGFMPGRIVVHGDLTEPMEGWEMLEED